MYRRIFGLSKREKRVKRNFDRSLKFNWIDKHIYIYNFLWLSFLSDKNSPDITNASSITSKGSIFTRIRLSLYLTMFINTLTGQNKKTNIYFALTHAHTHVHPRISHSHGYLISTVTKYSNIRIPRVTSIMHPHLDIHPMEWIKILINP